MKCFRTRRVRVGVAVLALLALALQGFVLNRHQAAMAAGAIQQASVQGALAELGLTDPGAICSELGSAADRDGGPLQKSTDKGTCLLCAAHACKTAVAALLPGAPTSSPPREAGDVLGPPPAKAIASAAAPRPNARGPPRTA